MKKYLFSLLVMLMTFGTSAYAIEDTDGVVYDFSIKNEVNEAIHASEEAMVFCQKNHR